MEPLKLKLTFEQVERLCTYLWRLEKRARHPQAREELIVLVEFLPKAYRMEQTALHRPHGKAYQYKLPVSVARILHRRWQLEPIEEPLQAMLLIIDQELVNRRLRPNPMMPEIF